MSVENGNSEKSRKLTGMQEAFVEFYCGVSEFCGVDAVRRAGYKGSYGSLRAIASQNLTKINIQAAIAERKAAIRKEGIAVQEARVRDINERWRRARAIIEERAIEYAGQCPGGGTGLLVRQEKVIGQGDNAIHVVEFTVDVGLLREIRELEADAAAELGHRKETQKPADSDGFSLQALLTLTVSEKASQLFRAGLGAAVAALQPGIETSADDNPDEGG